MDARSTASTSGNVRYPRGRVLWEWERDWASLNQRPDHESIAEVLGKPLFRLASLLLENDGGPPGFWRELGAAVISPPTGLNRLVFGNRFDAVFPSHDPAISWRFQLGAALNTRLTGPATSHFKQNEAIADFQLAMGCRKPGCYTRPFDYLNFQCNASNANTSRTSSPSLLVGAP